MCGRYTLTQKPQVADKTPDASAQDWQPNFNIAPTQSCLVTSMHQPQHISAFRWGLIPHWAKDMRIGYKLINARAETVAEKPAFCDAFQRHRCVVYADGFYEWKRQGKDKQPFRIVSQTDEILTFAGLAAFWRDPQGDTIASFTIITTTPNALMVDIHDRMPVILAAPERDAWLDPAMNVPGLKSLLIPYPADALRAYPVSKAVGNVRNIGPELVEEVA